MDVFDQFGVRVYRTVRSRGAFVCETNKGYKLFRETNEEKGKYAKEDYITCQVALNGYEYVDVFERTAQGELIAEDEDKKRYYMKRWFDAGECDTKVYSDILNACNSIGRLHKVLEKVDVKAYKNAAADVGESEETPDKFTIPVAGNLDEKYRKKIKEMRSVGNYLKKKKKKSDFERRAFENMAPYIKEAEKTLELINSSGYMGEYEKAVANSTLVHGSCNHHNILNGKGYVAAVSFERACINVPVTDLYDFMRKILEKYNWDIKLAYKMLDEYDKARTISSAELETIAVLFSFPEKFFKLMNHYYNSSKAWLPDKDIEKLDTVIKQNESRLRFVESLK